MCLDLQLGKDLNYSLVFHVDIHFLFIISFTTCNEVYFLLPSGAKTEHLTSTEIESQLYLSSVRKHINLLFSIFIILKIENI